MQTTRIPAISFLGISSGLPDTMKIALNKRELATVRRAVAIVEEVRDQMCDSMGTPDFEASLWYGLNAHDLADEDGVISWDKWPNEQSHV